MEEGIISFVLTGCRLAQDLESNLGRLNGPEELLEKCEHIADVFTAAIQALRALQSCHVAFPDHHSPQHGVLVSHNVPEAGGGSSVGVGPVMSELSKGKDVIRSPEFGVKGGGPGGASGGESSILTNTRKRKDETGKRIIEVAAPLHGNTEIPPDDGYTWRKYGQKEILNAQFPRGYFRCTHQRLYNCPAKKQVQRKNNNPRIFQIIYRGDHTCHMSSTAPASAIPPPPITADMAHLDVSLPRWFPVDISSNTSAFFDTNNFNVHGGQVTDTNVVGGSGGGTSPSNAVGVADMADAMFNPAGSGDDNIDFIFSKYDPRDAKD